MPTIPTRSSAVIHPSRGALCYRPATTSGDDKMKAARLYGARDLRVEQLDDPRPGPGEALIRIEACGVCPSDVRGYTGARQGAGANLPRTPGHEWTGIVEELGPPLEDAAGAPSVRVDEARGEGPLRVGDRVVADWRYVCGRCYQCR